MKRSKAQYDVARNIYQRPLSEDDILGQIRTLLELNKALVFRAIERVPKCYRCGLWLGSSEPGTPDLSGLLPKTGLMPYPWIFPFWFEIKRPKGGRNRAAQVTRIEEIRAAGGCAAIVRSWEEVVAEFTRHGIKLSVK